MLIDDCIIQQRLWTQSLYIIHVHTIIMFRPVLAGHLFITATVGCTKVTTNENYFYCMYELQIILLLPMVDHIRTYLIAVATESERDVG